MSDLLVGFGIALVMEGLMWALVPNLAVLSLKAIAETPPRQIRAVAWVVALVGLAIVWSVRG